MLVSFIVAMMCMYKIECNNLDFDGFENTVSGVSRIPVALDSSVAMECDVLDAKPPPEIKWYYNDDTNEIQEEINDNSVRFLDNGRYLYLKRLQLNDFERQYFCRVINANLSEVISAPTRYVLFDNLTQGELLDYKQIGDLIAFVGNTSFEFSYVGGVFGSISNRTVSRLFWNQSTPVEVLGHIGTIDNILLYGNFALKAEVRYDGEMTTKSGTLTVNGEFAWSGAAN